jgi:Cell wall-associated hydrolases (invasion-associated proteins)
VAPLTKNIVQVAHSYLGIPYVYGGDNPSSGLDCSGFLQNVYRQMGINLGRTTYQQFRQGKAVGLRNLKPGDAVFTVPSKAGPDHVGMYIGHGMVQESPHTGTKNSVIPLKSFLGDGFVGARRYGNFSGGPIGAFQGFQNGRIGGQGQVGNHSNKQQAMQLIQGVLGSHTGAQQPSQPQQDPFQVQLGLPTNG